MEVPDGGWGWVCVLGSFLANVALAGCTYSFGVVYLEILHHYHSKPSSTAWIGAILIVLFGANGPVATALSQRFGERGVAMVGGLIMSSGLICAGFAPNLGVVYLGYSVAGMGLSLTYTPGYKIIGQYFHKRKALAMSIASAGTSVGAFVLPPLIQMLIFHYGYSGAMLMLAGILLNTIVGGALLHPLNGTKHNLNDKVTESKQTVPLSSQESVELAGLDSNSLADIQREQEASRSSLCQVSETTSEKASKMKCSAKETSSRNTQRCNFTLLQYPCFWGMILISVSFTLSTGAATGFTVALAVDRGVRHTLAAFLLSVFAMADLLGRFVSGFLFDIRIIRPVRVYLYAASVLLMGLSTVALPLCWTYATLVLVTVIEGFSLGIFMAHRATIMADFVGQERTPMAFGILMFCNSVGSLTGRGIGGVLHDVTGSYDITFYLTGSSTAVSAMVFFVIIKCFYTPPERLSEDIRE